jgi:hypothetical protein
MQSKEIEILKIKFTKSLPAVTGAYFILMDDPPGNVDEYFCNPVLARVNVDEQGNRWVQYSQRWSNQTITPREWHPIPDNCGWWFSRKIDRVQFGGRDSNAQ